MEGSQTGRAQGTKRTWGSGKEHSRFFAAARWARHFSDFHLSNGLILRGLNTYKSLNAIFKHLKEVLMLREIGWSLGTVMQQTRIAFGLGMIPFFAFHKIFLFKTYILQSS